MEEYGTPFVPLDVFNGVLTDSNKVNIDLWRQIYATLHSSRIHGVNPLPNLASVNAITDSSNNNTASISVPLVYATYNYLRPDAISSNLLYVQNNQLYDVAGRTQSPYNSRPLFAAAPLVSDVRTGSVSLIFQPEMFFNASNKVVSAIQVDFNDGRGYLAATWNTAIMSSYSSTGEKQVKIKLKFSDNTIAECYTMLKVLEIPVAYRYSIDTTSFTQDFPSTATHSGGTVYGRYSVVNTTGNIKKPLIVVEGVDYHKIAPAAQENNYSYDAFIRDINSVGFDFNGSLDDQAGYDLIFLDFNNGADDITRNAALLSEVINWVNTEKAKATDHQKNVVLGVSMGGLVARYCLANMTKAAIPTDTRLLITHDSPHRGANTPFGIQALTLAMNEVDLIDLLNISPALQQSKRVLNAPASQQMLIVRATNGTGGYVHNSFINNIYQPMISFPDPGVQPEYKIVGTSLGSQCGIGSLTAGSELIRSEGTHFITPIPWITRSSFNSSIIVNALPSNGSSVQVSKVRLWVNYKILSFISISIDLTNKVALSPAGLLPWDGAPGGTRPIKSQAGDALPDYNIKLLPFLNLSMINTIADFFCFVPTVSALDIDNITQNTLYGSYFGGVTPQGTKSGLSDFIAQERFQFVGMNGDFFNMIHPRFTNRNARWIFREMEDPIGNNLNCTFECQFTISNIDGPSEICSVPVQYNLPNLANNMRVTWTTNNSNGLTIDSNTGVATRVNNFSGQVTIFATVTIGSCGSSIVERIVNVGSPVPNLSYVETIIPKKPTKYDFTATYYPGSTYQWYMNGVLQTNYTGNTFTMHVLCGMTKTVKCKLVNACGTSAFSMEYEFYGDCMTMATVSPNPASSELTVSFADESTGQEVMEEPKEIELYNSHQKKVYYRKTTDITTKVPVRDLPNGIYYLKIINSKATETKRILVAH